MEKTVITMQVEIISDQKLSDEEQTKIALEMIKTTNETFKGISGHVHSLSLNVRNKSKK